MNLNENLSEVAGLATPSLSYLDENLSEVTVAEILEDLNRQKSTLYPILNLFTRCKLTVPFSTYNLLVYMCFKSV